MCRGKLLETGDITYRLSDNIEPAHFRHWPAAILLAAIGGMAVFYVAIANKRHTDSSLVGSGQAQAFHFRKVEQIPVPEPETVARDQKIKAVVLLPMNSPGPKLAPSNLPGPIKAWAKKSSNRLWVQLAAKVKGRTEPWALPVIAKWPIQHFSEEELQRQLAKLPEVGLEQKLADQLRTAHYSTDMRSIIRRGKEETKVPEPVDPHEFLAQLRKKQPWLAELPLREGLDCRLDAELAKEFGAYSVLVRCALGAPQERLSSFSNSASHSLRLPRAPEAFWKNLQTLSGAGNILDLKKCDWQVPHALRALGQILAVEETPFRVSLVEHLRKPADAKACVALAKTALFDVDREVRQAALAGLQSRPPAEFASVLVEGFRYPWGPVARNAAVALAELNVTEAVPALIALLDEAEPGLPFRAKSGQFMIRELVRINHHRNCLLCHVPSKSMKDPARGPVPVPGKRLPSLADYFEPGHTFVRADVTYLRQDFSTTLEVKDHGAWPAKQRFDFVIRVRPLKKEEAMKYRGPEFSEHKYAIRYALHALTGIDAGFSAPAWRQALAISTRQTNWHSPCLK
ncbi:MAG TPA: HEAT repeat domain-containing protein [Gemmataceae bacterium]|nr:HEAT repeat domain-containing protein [Gemmataceae bacterium]